MASAVSLDNVTKLFGDVVAVDGITLDIADGEFFSMLGPSGSGKTTCLRMIAGFEIPTSGGFKQSGFGKDMSEESVLDYTITKHVMVKHA